MIQRFIIGLIGVLLVPLSLLAQTTVTAELSTTKMLIGDQVNLQIRVGQSGTAQVDIDLNPLAEVEGLEIVKQSDPIVREEPGLQFLEQNITITSFDSGEYLIPQIPVRLIAGEQNELYHTNPIPLSVMTIPVAVDSVQLAPIKDIIREEFAWLDALPYFLGALAVLIIGFLVWFFVFRKPASTEKNIPEIIRPPHEIALDKLEILEKQKWWQQGKLKRYYSELTYISREYLENRFQVPALESTSGEILQKIQGMPEIDATLLEQLRRILNASDMVKFAKAEPPAAFHMEALEQTRAFIEVTQQHEIIEVEEEMAEEAAEKTETPTDESSSEVKA